MDASPNFGRQADRYARYRPVYPAGVFTPMREALPRNGPSNAIDLGAGTGQAAITLCNWFDRIDAVEPDPALSAHIPDRGAVCVQTASADQVTLPDHGASAVVCASAYHWIGSPKIAQKIHDWLVPDGVLYLISLGPLQIGDDAAPVQALLNEIRRDWAPYRSDAMMDWRPYPKLLAAHGWRGPIRTATTLMKLRWSGRQLAGFLLTTSAALACLNDKPDPEAYAREIETAFETAAAGADMAITFTIDQTIALAV